MKALTSLFVLLPMMVTSTYSLAAAKVKYLSVKEEVVYFSLTDPKSHTKLACVSDENTEIWAFPLTDSDADQKLTLLTTAFANNLNITITSTGQCVNNFPVEKTNEITFG